MPNTSLHISFADDAARALGHPLLSDYSGSYLLGSTAPDVRNLAGWDRYSTHFFDLAKDEPGKGIQGLFETYPELADAASLGHETRAFVLGYMCHLVTDEYWIAQVYRPYFGKRASSDPITNVLDRVLQFDMDKRERNGIRDLDAVLDALKSSDVGVKVSFIDPDLPGTLEGRYDRTHLHGPRLGPPQAFRKEGPAPGTQRRRGHHELRHRPGPRPAVPRQRAGPRPRYRRLPGPRHRPVRRHRRGVPVVRVITDFEEARAFLHRLHAAPGRLPQPHNRCRHQARIRRAYLPVRCCSPHP